MLRVDAAGRGGLPILFVHGNGGNRSQWAEQLAHFSPSRAVAALDLSGMGDSELLPGGTIRVEGFAADVEAAADALGFERYVLVGHSYGGAVVAACAGRRPDRIAAVVFADCAGDLHATPPEQIPSQLSLSLEADFRKFTDKWFEGILVGSLPETRAAVLDSLHRTPREVFSGATDALYAFRLDEAARPVPRPHAVDLLHPLREPGRDPPDPERRSRPPDRGGQPLADDGPARGVRRAAGGVPRDDFLEDAFFRTFPPVPTSEPLETGPSTRRRPP